MLSISIYTLISYKTQYIYDFIQSHKFSWTVEFTI